MIGRKDLVMKVAKSIADDDFLKMWDSLTFSEARDAMVSPVLINTIAQEYRAWISTGTISPVLGLDSFQKVVMTNAVTNSLEVFFMANRNKRIRMLRGEYPYIKRLMGLYGLPIAYIDNINRPEKGDVIILSWPFSATGDTHWNIRLLLDTCDMLDIPVFVDCAFWPVCEGVIIDLSRKCIKNAAFSFSKSFQMAGVRVGIEFIKDADAPHPQNVLLGHYFNRLGAYIVRELIRTYTPDYVVSKYRHIQKKVCKELGLVPSKTIIFGLSDEPEWDEYSRDGIINRPCITKAIEREAVL